MVNGIEDVAAAFAEVIAADARDELVDDAGAPALAGAPLDGGASASLGYNGALGVWVLRVEHPLDHVAEDARPDFLETLAKLGAETRFSSPQVAGLTGENTLSLTTQLPDRASETTIGTLLGASLAILRPDAPSRPAPDDRPPPMHHGGRIYG